MSHFSVFFKYSSLSVLGMMAISCYILADTFFIAKGLGTNGLAALNLAIPAYNLINGIGLMLGMGGATKYSIYKSQENHKDSNIMFTNTLYMAGMFSIILVLVGIFLSENITTMLGANEEVFKMTNTYLKMLFIFSPAFILNGILISFVRNDENPHLAMVATVGSSFANIILDYIFIFPLGMGIFGAVLATCLAPVIGVIMMIPHWISKSRGFRLIKVRLQRKMVTTNLMLGFPTLLTQLSASIVMITFNILILGLKGNVGVAAYGVIANISLVVIGIYIGIAQGVQPIISSAYGEGKNHHVKEFLKYAMASMVILSVGLYAMIFLFADSIAHLFNSENNSQLQELATIGLKLYFTSIIFAGFNVILSMFYTSVEEPFVAHIISLMRGLLLVVPIAIIMAKVWGMTGVWLVLSVTEAIVAIIGLLYWQKEEK